MACKKCGYTVKDGDMVAVEDDHETCNCPRCGIKTTITIINELERLNMEDSGKRQEFETGAVRDAAEGKSRPDLISPYALMREGDWLAKGAQKYAERNWEAGMPIGRCVASMIRHVLQYIMGMRNEDHLAAIACNAHFIMHYEAMIEKGLLPKELDDMPRYETLANSAIDPKEIHIIRAVRKSLYTENERDEIIKNILAVTDEAKAGTSGSFDTSTLVDAFEWHKTPQKRSYWKDIHNRLLSEDCYDKTD